MNKELKIVLKRLFIKRYSKFITFLVFAILFYFISKVECPEIWRWLKLIDITILSLGLIWLMDRWFK